MADNSGSETGKSPSDSATDYQPRPRVGILPNPLIDDLKGTNSGQGVLIPLKTTQEVRQDHTIVQAYITRAPTKSANDVITYVALPAWSLLSAASCTTVAN